MDWTSWAGAYTPPGAGAIVLSLPDQADNTRISFAGARIEDASFAAQLDRVFRITKSHQALLNSGFSNPAQVELRITPSTGAFQGAFAFSTPIP